MGLISWDYPFNNCGTTDVYEGYEAWITVESFTDIFMMDLMSVISMMALSLTGNYVMYGVCLLDSRKISIFFSISKYCRWRSSHNLAALVLRLECLGKVRHHAISHTTLQLLLGGLMGEDEASQLALCPWPTHQCWICCPRWWRNHSNDLFILHFLLRQFGHPPCWPLRAADPCEEWCE